MAVRWSVRAGLVVSVYLSLAAAAAGAAAPAPAVSILHPRDGATITGPSVPFAIRVRGFKLDCALAGKANRPGVGHWHVHLDDVLIDMACGSGYLISLRNVKPGRHTLTAVLTTNDHTELTESSAKVTFVYRPENPLPALTGLKAGKPELSIVAPKNGTTVSGQTFPLLLSVRNFRLSCELYGKGPLSNTGHWHVDFEESAPRMATMMFMGCSNTAEIPLKGLSPGNHTFIVLLVDNLHYPIIPEVTARVTVTVK